MNKLSLIAIFLAASVATGCHELSAESEVRTRLSLNDLYAVSSDKIKFCKMSQKSEKVLTNERISEKWRKDFLIATEGIVSLDSQK